VARSSQTLIQLHSVSKEYAVGPVPVRAVQHASLTLKSGEFVLLQGPSGSGKTTLLSIMGLLMKPTAGRVWLCGQDVTSFGEDQLPGLRLRHIGFIFQTYNLFPALTAFQNVTLALKLKGFGWRERRREAAHLLDRVGLTDCMYRRPDELSGGQRQRVSIARAMSGDADILLADEPTAALDTHTGLEVMGLLKEESLAGRKGIFVVTHDVRLEKFETRVDHIIDGVLTPDARSVNNGNGPEAKDGQTATPPEAQAAQPAAAQ
jgi:putative ABC transport system ATP-binding protein